VNTSHREGEAAMPSTQNRFRFAAITLITLLTLLGSGLWLIQWRHTAAPGDTILPAAEAEQIHNSFARGIRSTIYNEAGQLEIHLQADEQISYQNNITRLSQPVLQFFDDDLLRWHIQASSGRILGALSSTDSIELFELITSVTIEHADAAGHRLRIETEFLTIDPREESLHTDLPVRVSSQGFEQRALGMHANLLQDTVTFFANLEGRFHDTAY